MNTIMLLKHPKQKIVIALYYKSEYRAIWSWSYLFREEWEVIYLKERKPSGHRYNLIYTKCEEQEYQHSRNIICFSKKEALYLKNKIERMNQHYIFQINKLY